MQRNFHLHMNENEQNGDNGASRSVLRAVMLFGALAVAMALVLIPVGLKWTNSSLMDNTQYATAQSSAQSAYDSHSTGHNR